jgi:hypothetical protein
MAASFILGGGLLLSSRTAPAGLAALAPAVSVILLFYLFLSVQTVVGILVAVIFLALVCNNRRAFLPLLTWRPDGQDGQADRADRYGAARLWSPTARRSLHFEMEAVNIFPNEARAGPAACRTGLPIDLDATGVAARHRHSPLEEAPNDDK